jgi:hypothetical protein
VPARVRWEAFKMYRGTKDIMLPTTITGSQAECLAADARYSLIAPAKE